MRYNEDDIYGDGNNFEIAIFQGVAEAWEREVGEKLVAAAAAAEAAAEAAEAAKPGRKKKKKAAPKASAPWVSAGSEFEIAEEGVLPAGAPVVVEVFRRRREFGGAVALGDADSADLWNSSQMECRPFKDTAFTLDRMEAHVATQAVPATSATGVQATAGASTHGATQYAPLTMSPEEARAHLDDGALAAFLARVDGLMEEALQQNEAFDIFTNDFATLADDDAAVGANAENVITEYQSFTDLTYSKGKQVSCIDWLGSTRGVVAVSCTEPASFEERVEACGVSKPGAVLIWNFVDPIHPQYVLEAPTDVYSFAFNPVNPNLVAGGLLNGQVCLWDTSEVQRLKEAGRKKSSKNASSGGGDGADGGGSGGSSIIPVCQPKFVSELHDSHVFAVTDLHWLGADVQICKPQGKLDNPKTGACDFFATTAADGKVFFWDIRVKEDPKKHEMLWGPMYKISMTRGDVAGDLAAIKFNFGDLKNDSSMLYCSSMDGEVALCDFSKPDNDPHPEHAKLVSSAHAGPVRSIERSPFFPDIMMSVGDWTFKLFKQGEKTPLFSSPSADAYLSAGCFSPTRPGVLFTAKQDGTVDVWDFLDRSHEASLMVRPETRNLKQPELYIVNTKALHPKPKIRSPKP
jgi:WD40 repeat protein